jgi:hypothetical protein
MLRERLLNFVVAPGLNLSANNHLAIELSRYCPKGVERKTGSVACDKW